MRTLKQLIHLNYIAFRSNQFYEFYRDIQNNAYNLSPSVVEELLANLFLHCKKFVPYYADLINQLDNEDCLRQNSRAYLQKLPILTKDIIRLNFDRLKSEDLVKRKYYFNTSGGSTGEPIKLIQDAKYTIHSAAITSLFSYLVGKELSEPEVRIWGSERDIFQGSMGWKANLFNFLGSITYMNAFRMTVDTMKAFIEVLNKKRPKLIVAYAQAIYELAKFSQSENIRVLPQKAIITSAGTLYPWMRSTIESVFQCKVYNRYGSREVGDIACERPEYEGLWVAPWGNYIEIVDDNNQPVPLGVEGNIIITSLTNYAMPLVRYKIGDRGCLLPTHDKLGQVLQRVSGRNVDTFKTEDGTLIDGEYFTHLLYYKNWVRKFQIIQNSYSKITVKIVKDSSEFEADELKEIEDKCKLVIGKNCSVKFEFVEDIFSASSGKYRYTISEVN